MDLSQIKLMNMNNFSKNVLKNNDICSSLMILDEMLSHRTYLVDDIFSDADLEVFLTLKRNHGFVKLQSDNKVPTNVARYLDHLATLDEIKKRVVKEETKVVKAVKEEKSKSNIQFEEGGKFIGLKGAENGNVIVRFPPEASGYLHIGHAKAALINYHYRETYKGKLIMRFDDTNPAKESLEFEKIILEDVKSLGIEFDHFSRSSDHFDLLLRYCEKLIERGLAYADNTDPEQMKREREAKTESKCRNQSVEENQRLWEEMKVGTDLGLTYCVRIKMDMDSNNGCMRDPTIYRCKKEHHIMTGDKYKVYPTYDFACPIVDSIEGVTHTLRTSEYNDRNEQFNRILDLLELRKPIISDYSRFSLQNTVLSKRKLTYIVNEGLVDGWNDPRMPTVRGILRHGMTIAGLKEFVLAQGFGRANVVMEWDKIWAFNKKVIDPIAPRYTGLVGSDESLVLVRVAGQTSIEKGSVAKHPKNESVGQKSIWFTPTVLVERSDAVDFVENKNVTFINWGNILITKINRDNANKIVSIDAQLNLSDRDFKKTLKVTWMPLGSGDDLRSFSIPMNAIFFDHIITKNVLGKDDDFKDFLNKDSKREDALIGDLELRDLKKGDIIQLQRRGYFIVDEEYREKCSTTGREYPLVLINIPEGNSKERPTTGSKTNKTHAENAGGDSVKKQCEKKKVAEKQCEKIVEKGHKKKNQGNENIEKPVPEAKSVDSTMKKVTRLGLEVKKEDNFSAWYTEVILKSKMVNYSDISGCYIIYSLGMNIWRRINWFFYEEIEKRDVEDCSFPLFISKSSLVKEKDHIADFSPEVAWVTKAGDKNLKEELAIRPTSETAMYPVFAKDIRTYRDLPLKMNQWCNVVRWEFKDPIPFLRSREFLWQEGHTAYANATDAINEVYDILDLYSRVYRELLAVPVVKGRKTEKEKFAGADFTTTTEIYIAGSGRAIQGATSHHLGQNFSKMFGIEFDTADGKREFAYQNSWGLTTRTIGVVVMTHSDNKGLVLPPRVAKIQVMIVPVGISAKSTEEDIKKLEEKCVNLYDKLFSIGVRVKTDLDRDRSPGWKFNNWDLKGVPIRIEVGPKELLNNQLVLCYRYNGVKETISANESIGDLIKDKLNEIHNAMYEAAKHELDTHRIVGFTMEDLCRGLDQKMLITAPFCGDKKCEEKIKELSARGSVVEEGAPSMGAKSLCIPFEQPENLGESCVNNFCSNKPKYFTMFGRSY